MLYSNKNYIDEKLFKNPTSEYRCTPFWAWNCKLNKDLLLEEIDFMKEMGMGGFHMHTRTGMAIKYLSDDFMDLIKACTEKAKKEKMLAWLYDEDKWPSGFAGGYVTEKIENRQKFLMITTTPYSNTENDDVHINASASVKRSENGYLLSKYSVILDESGYLLDYKRLSYDQTAEGTIWYCYLETPKEGPWFNGQTYSDTMKKSAVEDFINITHERYKQVVGDEFGNTIPAIFTDEPQITQKGFLDFAKQKKDIVLPYTTDFEDIYIEKYGTYFLDALPEVLWDKKDEVSITRYRYHDISCEIFVSAYCDTIGEWCKKNNILMTGHVMNEPNLTSQTSSLGEAMRCYRSFDLPGVDMLCDAREFTTVKQAASVSHQYGRAGVLSELYGVTNWDFDFRGHKLQGDWQAALGVNVRVPHLYWVSMQGEAKRDYPASIGHQSSWYKEYSYIEDHFARVNTLMTRGTPNINIGVIHPIESFWIYYGAKDLTGDIRQYLDDNFRSFANWMITSCLDYDYISESLLPSLYEESEDGFKIGKMTYDVIVVPNCITLRSTTLNALKKFADNGGEVIFVGSIPKYVDAVKSDEVTDFAQGKLISNTKFSLIKSLEKYRKIAVKTKNGDYSNNIAYNLRTDGKGLNLFLSHIFPKSIERILPPEEYTITVKGEYKPQLFDTFTGEISEYPAEYINGNTVISWKCFEHSSILLRLEEGKTNVLPQKDMIYCFDKYISGPVSVTLDEPNVCVLDMAKWRIDNGEWHEKEEMLRICAKAKKMLNMSEGVIYGMQPWALPEIDCKNNITLEIEFDSEVEFDDAQLALENIDETEIEFNGKLLDKNVVGYYVDRSISKIALDRINKGKNVLTLTRPFSVKTCIENVFVLGDFGVNVRGTEVAITNPVRQLQIGDWTKQGLPFYGGKVSYNFDIEKCDDMSIRLGLFKAPCVTADIDGKKIANVSLSPFEVDLSNVADGNHTLTINVYGSRINTFGTLHLANGELKWFNQSAWRTKEGDWSYDYRLYEQGLLTALRVYNKKVK